MSTRTITLLRDVSEILCRDGDHILVDSELRYVTTILDAQGTSKMIVTAPAQREDAVPVQLFVEFEDLEPDPALWPSALLVCVNDQAGFFFDEAPTHKCPLCNAELLEVAMWDGSFSKENAQ